MHLNCRYILPLLLAGATSASAQLTLSNAVATALAGNPDLRAAREQIEAATGRAQQARLWANPELELSSEDVPVKDGGFSDAKNMIGVAQTVPFPGKKSLDAQIGAKEVSATEWAYRQREIDLVREVKVTFYRTLAAQEKLAVDRQLAELAQSTAAAVHKRVEAGAAGEQERLRAEVEQERVAVELSGARRALAESQRELAALLGRARETVGPLAGELSDRVAEFELEQVREQMLARHPNIKAARADRERAELELRRAKLDPWPDVRFGVAGGYDGAANQSLMEFRIAVPLPFFDRSQGRKREARALAEIAGCNLSSTELRLSRDLDLVDERIRAASEQVTSYRTRILPKAEQALKLVRGGFESGKFGFLDLVDTQRTLAETRLAYLDKLLELNLSLADLEALAGTTTKE